MPFIRVTDAESQQKVDLNVAHIVAFTPANGRGNKVATHVALVNGQNYAVIDTVRQIRGFIKKAEGTLPDADETSLVIHQGSI